MKYLDEDPVSRGELEVVWPLDDEVCDPRGQEDPRADVRLPVPVQGREHPDKYNYFDMLLRDEELINISSSQSIFRLELIPPLPGE